MVDGYGGFSPGAAQSSSSVLVFDGDNASLPGACVILASAVLILSLQ